MNMTTAYNDAAVFTVMTMHDSTSLRAATHIHSGAAIASRSPYRDTQPQWTPNAPYCPPHARRNAATTHPRAYVPPRGLTPSPLPPHEQPGRTRQPWPPRRPNPHPCTCAHAATTTVPPSNDTPPHLNNPWPHTPSPLHSYAPPRPRQHQQPQASPMHPHITASETLSHVDAALSPRRPHTVTPHSATTHTHASMVQTHTHSQGRPDASSPAQAHLPTQPCPEQGAQAPCSPEARREVNATPALTLSHSHRQCQPRPACKISCASTPDLRRQERSEGEREREERGPGRRRRTRRHRDESSSDDAPMRTPWRVRSTLPVPMTMTTTDAQSTPTMPTSNGVTSAPINVSSTTIALFNPHRALLMVPALTWGSPASPTSPAPPYVFPSIPRQSAKASRSNGCAPSPFLPHASRTLSPTLHTLSLRLASHPHSPASPRTSYNLARPLRHGSHAKNEWPLTSPAPSPLPAPLAHSLPRTHCTDIPTSSSGSHVPLHVPLSVPPSRNLRNAARWLRQAAKWPDMPTKTLIAKLFNILQIFLEAIRTFVNTPSRAGSPLCLTCAFQGGGDTVPVECHAHSSGTAYPPFSTSS
ncbi:hypothetical protein K439DRAFT_1619138 [Ramaria rubella]|nr:hypothetical protein K439DRAFT_1619138 [Ramaria rubella]